MHDSIAADRDKNARGGSMVALRAIDDPFAASETAYSTNPVRSELRRWISVIWSLILEVDLTSLSHENDEDTSRRNKQSEH